MDGDGALEKKEVVDMIMMAITGENPHQKQKEKKDQKKMEQAAKKAK